MACFPQFLKSEQSVKVSLILLFCRSVCGHCFTLFPLCVYLCKLNYFAKVLIFIIKELMFISAEKERVFFLMFGINKLTCFVGNFCGRNWH